MTKNIKQEIEDATKTLVGMIREYSRSQQYLWQQVSLLASEVKRKASLVNVVNSYTFFVDAYDDGYLGISTDFTRTPRLYVDLKTGELVGYYNDDKTKSAPDKFVLQLAFSFYESLNADRIFAKLSAEAKELDYIYQQDGVKERVDFWLQARKERWR